MKQALSFPFDMSALPGKPETGADFSSERAAL